ncbi:tandem-95 repeat protein, partial [Aliivibrio finisterrensis]
AGVTATITLPEGTNTAEDSVVVTFSDGTTETIKLSEITVTDGKFSVAIPAAAIVDDQTTEVSAIVVDAAGNESATGSDTASVDLVAPGDGEGDNGSDVAPTVVINSGEDDIINAAEKDAGVTASIELPEGTNIAEDSVVVTFSDGTTETIKLSEITVTDGKFSVAIPAAAIVDGQTTEVSAIVVDAAGNESAAGSDTADVDLVAPGDGEGDNGGDVAPTVVINSGDDDTINADEKDAGVTATITLPEGTNTAEDSVVVTFSDGTTETIKLSEITVTDGKFSVAIPAAAIVDGQTTEVSAIVVDAAGNESATGSDTADVDLVAPGDGEGDNGGDVAPTVVINSGDDDTINADEKDVGVTATITLPEGTNIAEDSVVVTFSDGTTDTIKLSEITVTDGKFSVAIPAAAIVDGQTTEVSAIVVDAADNESATGSDTADVDLVAPGDGEGDNGSDVAPTVVINSGDDDTINADEKDAGVTASIELPEGTDLTSDSLVISINGGEPQTIKLSDATFDESGKVVVSIPASAIVDGTPVKVDAIVVDVAGNESATGSDTAGVDLVAPGDGEGDNGGDVAPTVLIDSGDDDTINAVDKDVGVTATITLPEGTNIAEDSVVVTFSDGTTDTIKLSEITVTDGKFSVAIPATAIVDGQITEVSAIVVDVAGNESATGSDTAGVDLVAPGDGEGDNGGDVAPTVVINSGEDDIINAAEKDAGVTATITLPEGTNTAEDSVVVTFSDGTTETIKLSETTVTDGKFSVAIPAAAIVDGQTTEVSAIVVDAAGNESVEGSDRAEVDTTYGEDIDEPGNDITQPTVSITDNTGDEAELISGTENADITVRFGEGVSSGTAQVVISDEDGDTANDITLNVTLNSNGTATVDGGYTVTQNDDGTYTINDVDVKTLVDGTLTANATFTDSDGNVAIAKDDVAKDTVAPNPPAITNITDDSAASDYSTVTLHGTGEPGATITIYDEDNNVVNSSTAITVDSDGNWTLDISDLSETPVGDNEFFSVTQTDENGNVSLPSEQSHYAHGAFSGTDDYDDYVLLGKGDDTFNLNDDDKNDRVVVDGGAGTDTAVLDSNLSDCKVSLNENGEIVIVDKEGDTNIFRDFEQFEFKDKEDAQSVSDLFKPVVTIIDDKNNDGVINKSELEGKVTATFTLPPAAVAGMILLITIDGNAEPYALTEADIELGTVTREVDVPEHGESINADASMSYEGQTFSDSDKAVMESNSAPDAVNDILIFDGLAGSYYGYNDRGPDKDGNDLSSIEQVLEFINGNDPDASFIAKELDYEREANDLGEDDTLQDFLGVDADSLSSDPGDSTDAILHIEGQVDLEPGRYGFKVTADDGYLIKIDGVIVAQYNGNQSSSTTTPGEDGHIYFDIDTPGFHEIEIVYWDHGGACELSIELGKFDENNQLIEYKDLGDYPLSHQGSLATEDNIVTITPEDLLGNDTDIDGDELTIVGVSNPTNGTVSINDDGEIEFKPSENFSGDVTFDYTISDGNGGTDTATVTINIDAVADVPELTIKEVNDISFGNNGFVTDIILSEYIGGELTDTDGSEALSYELSNLPSDAVILVGDELIPINNGIVELTAEQLSTAKIQLPLSYTGKLSVSIVAISTETSNGDQARSEAQIIDWVVTDIPNVDEDVNSEGDLVDSVQVVHAGTEHEYTIWASSGSGKPNVMFDKNDTQSGLIVDAGAAGDDIYLGSGDDTIYLGDSHAGGFDVNPDDPKLINAQNVVENIFSKGSDLSHLQDGVESGSFKNISADSNAYLDLGHGGNGNDKIFGQNGVDIMFGGKGDDYLNGGNDNDGLRGGSGNDILDGGSGNDILIGGLGDDILTGGTGEDIFKWVDQGVDNSLDNGTDTIKDFTVGEDLIDLTEIIGGDDNVINMGDLLSHITVSEDGDDLTLSITDDSGNEHDIVVEGAVTSFGLENADFSNQSEVLTKLLNDQMFKLDDIT